MKKTLVILGLLLFTLTSVQAQRFALIDMEYLLRHIPAYETANEQLNQLSRRWQSEVEARQAEIHTMFQNYQTESVFLSDEMRRRRENEIVQAEVELQELRRRYFGPNGELFRRRESLIRPIQDDIFNAVRAISEEQGFQLVLDRASGNNIIFASPRIDISDEVLSRLGLGRSR